MTGNRIYDGIIDMDAQFYERVYAEVAKIPAGKVCTYGKIAELAGYPKASREVGLAMSRVEEEQNLPCHRVVNKTGTLAPGRAFGGKENQKKMLESEGVTFLDDEHIDVQKHMWPDDSPYEQMSLL